MAFIKNYAYAAVLGIILTLAGWGIMTWQFYVATILIVILVVWRGLK